jgi:hypothetical protein
VALGEVHLVLLAGDATTRGDPGASVTELVRRLRLMRPLTVRGAATDAVALSVRGAYTALTCEPPTLFAYVVDEGATA